MPLQRTTPAILLCCRGLCCSVVAGAVRSAFTNNGQVCLAGSRLFVHKSIYEPFLEKFVASVERLKCGDPMVRVAGQWV